jgi:hypothetical protein
MKRHQFSQTYTNQHSFAILVSGGLLILMGLLIHWRGVLQNQARMDQCQEVVQPKAVLSRHQLSQLISISANNSTQVSIDQAKVEAIAKVPYCRLSSVTLPTGAIAKRDAYPLAFDPDTWLIILYEGNQYTGYDFSFRH